MHVISLLAQKGGVGKSTLAISLAVAAVLDGKSVLIIDLDPQATSCNWSDRREAAAPGETPNPRVVDAQAARLPAALAKAEQGGIELVLIDTPARSEQSALAAAKASDLVLIPCRPQTYDLETVPNSLEIVELAGNKPALAILNAVPPKGSRHEQAIALLTRLGLDVCPHTIGTRAAFGDSGFLGKAPIEYEPHGKAAEEIRAIYDYITRLLNTAQTKGKSNNGTAKARLKRAVG